MNEEITLDGRVELQEVDTAPPRSTATPPPTVVQFEDDDPSEEDQEACGDAISVASLVVGVASFLFAVHQSRKRGG